MKNLRSLFSEISPAIPHIYFSIILLLMTYSGSLYPLILMTPFILQIIYRNKLATGLLGSLMMLFSLWLCLALLSDIVKADEIRNYWFLIIGIPFVIFNIIMSGWLLKNSSITIQ